MTTRARIIAALACCVLLLTTLGCKVPADRGTRSLLAAGPPSASPLAASIATAGEGSHVVLLLHGLFRSKLSMMSVRNHLLEEGYDARDWPYRSTRNDVAAHGADLLETLKVLERDPAVAEVSIVGHSLGGIVARAALAAEVPSKVKRVVMMAPPNRGSETADRFSWFDGMIAPLSDLKANGGSSLLEVPAPRGVAIGIIAGSKDRTVPVERTHMEGQTDHIVIKSGHTMIVYKSAAREQILAFLENERFRHDPPAE